MSMKLAALTVSMAGAFALPALAQDAAKIAMQGNGKGAAGCQACHGADGGGQPAAGFPRLAGLNADYLQHQLDSYADGSRDNSVMKATASALSEPERKAMAAYYSRMPVPKAAAPAAAAAADPIGETLATRGRWAQQVPGCDQCHGPAGVGVGAGFPPLAGQSANYLVAQLKAFRSGTRHNDPLELMRHVAQQLSDQDIDAVAQWYAAQPAPTKEVRP